MLKLGQHPLVENGIIEEMKLVSHTTRAYVPYSFRTVVWVLLCPTRTKASDHWANQAKAASVVIFYCFFSGYDVDPRTHGSSSGYHSDEASPTAQKNEPSSIHDFRMPGMLEDQESPILSRKPVQPSDVIITVNTNFSERCQQEKNK